MKVTKRQLKRIIKEYSSQAKDAVYGGEDVSYSDEDVRDYLATNARTYRASKNLSPGAIEELLMDDFVDNLGAYVDFSEDYVKFIRGLARGEINESSKSRLVEYSDYPSWADLSDQMDDIAEILDMAADKYVTSAWLHSGENEGNAIAKSVAERLEQLYRDAESLGGLIRGSGALKK